VGAWHSSSAATADNQRNGKANLPGWKSYSQEYEVESVMKKVLIICTVLVMSMTMATQSRAEVLIQDADLAKIVSQVAKLKFVPDKSEGKLRKLVRSVCDSVDADPEAFIPVIKWGKPNPWLAVDDTRWLLNINTPQARQIVTRIFRDGCKKRTLVDLNVPLEGWNEVVQGGGLADTRLKSSVTGGEILPLGNAWQMNGRLYGYVASGEWYKFASVTLEFLDANMAPVFENYHRFGVGGRVIDIQPDRPYLEGFPRSTWLATYSPGSDYSSFGSGSDFTRLGGWAKASYAKVVSLTGSSSALIVLSAPPKEWIYIK